MTRYIKSGTVNTIQEVNSELTKIASSQVDFFTRNGEEPNAMQANLDMDSNRIINLPLAVSQSEPITLAQAELIANGSISIVNKEATSESFSEDLNPKRHLRRLAQTDTPVVCIMGDSISTPTPTITLDEVDSMWGVIQRRMLQDNPDLAFTFENRAIGGSTWTNANPATNLNATGLTLPTWVTDGGVQPWLDYVEALAPDVLYLAWGMNDRQNFVTVQFRAAIQQIQTWTKVPDIIFVTNMRPNATSTTPSIGDEVSQQGRDFVANYVRTYAKYNGLPIIDLNRFQNIKVGGYDPTQSYLERTKAIRDVVTTPYTVNALYDCSDFGWSANIANQSATFWNSPLKFSLSPYAPNYNNSASFLEISDDAGSLKVVIADIDDAAGRYISTTTSIPTPLTSSNSTITLFVKGGYLNLQIDAQVLYKGAIRRHGGKHLPKIEFVSAKSESLSVFFYKGTYNPYTPIVTDAEMWGVAGEGGNKGGNVENHPTSQGAARIYWSLFKSVDFRQPVMTEGSTGFIGTTERKVGVRKIDPKGLLHIGDGANADVPNTTANNFVLEDPANVGMTLMSNNTGVARIIFADEDNNNIGGINYVHATDKGNLRAGGVDALSFTSTRVTAADQLRFKAENGIVTNDAANRSMQFTLVNDTTLRIYVRGNDGTLRSSDLTLA